jgi:transposase
MVDLHRRYFSTFVSEEVPMDIQPIFRCAVGMDVHLAVIHVCVILQEAGCEPEVHRRPFGAFQRDRRAMTE